ncbi:MAG: hypothetical protein IJ829_03940 [Kiritimatiellae bacterium]|nr:hypothetical protein [Kiritimatiellia bacterium]
MNISDMLASPRAAALGALALLVSPLAAPTAAAWEMLVWANRASDMNAASSWNDANGDVSAVAPSADTVLVFPTNAVVQPVLTASMTVIGLNFGAATNSTSKAVVGVHPADGEGGYNYSGYRITGASGAVLTLDGNTYNNGWTRDLNMASKGTNSIAVPVVFTDNRAHYVHVSGGRFVFEKPVSTHATAEFKVGSAAYGRVVFAAANDDFAPTSVRIDGVLAIGDPRAMAAVPKFTSGCWGWGTSVNGFTSEKACRFVNETAEPAVITAESIELDAHDGFYMDGGPFPMSNTVFKAAMRDTKPIGGSANVVVKEVVFTGWTQKWGFNKSGTGTFVNLGGFCTESAYTNYLQVSEGTYVAMTPEGLSQYRNYLKADAYPDNPIASRLGVNFDYAPEHSSDEDGDLTFSHVRRPSGFAAVGGVRHVNLYGGALLRRGLTHPVLGGDFKQFANTLGFGAEGTDGTIVLDNDIDLNSDQGNANYNEYAVSVWDGDAFVDARFAGMVTNAPDAKPTHRYVRLSKKEAGVLALDGPCYVTCDGRVYAGGLLVNNTIDCKYIVYDGAWIGGTGRTLALEVQSGGGLRPGELGGELEVSGSLSLADGAKVLVDLGPDTAHGCANFTGANVALDAAGAVVVELCPFGDLKSGGRVKILDYSAATATSATAFDLTRYSVVYDDDVFSRARLSAEGAAIYLSYGVRSHQGLVLRIR